MLHLELELKHLYQLGLEALCNAIEVIGPADTIVEHTAGIVIHRQLVVQEPDVFPDHFREPALR